VTLLQLEQTSVGPRSNLFQPGVFTQPDLTFDFLRTASIQNRPDSVRRPRTEFIEKKQALATANVETFVTDELDSKYIFDDRASVAAYISEHRLYGILALAANPLAQAFGAATRKTLKLVNDDEGSAMLFCVLSVDCTVERALRCLESFDLNWWQSHSFAVAGKLNFDFELI
jgi:hypothetical protein